MRVVQERLTKEIAQAISEAISPKGVGVVTDRKSPNHPSAYSLLSPDLVVVIHVHDGFSRRYFPRLSYLRVQKHFNGYKCLSDTPEGRLREFFRVLRPQTWYHRRFFSFFIYACD